MTVLHHLPTFTERADLIYLWHRIKDGLQDYFIEDRKSGRYAQRIGHLARDFIDKIQKLPEFEQIIYTAQNKPRRDYPWHRYELAYDDAMQIELVTVFGDYPTPLHSYDGPAGIIYIVQGKLRLCRYCELNHEISDFCAITKLQCQSMDTYQSTQCTLIDSISAPVVEMETDNARSIFFNIHLKDHADHPHYFYYPSYLSREKPEFFSRRVPAEW
jgi:hypothetical protein